MSIFHHFLINQNDSQSSIQPWKIHIIYFVLFFFFFFFFSLGYGWKRWSSWMMRWKLRRKNASRQQNPYYKHMEKIIHIHYNEHTVRLSIYYYVVTYCIAWNNIMHVYLMIDFTNKNTFHFYTIFNSLWHEIDIFLRLIIECRIVILKCGWVSYWNHLKGDYFWKSMILYKILLSI